MAKVFRLFQDRDLQDWEDRGEPYGPSVIEQIENPDGDFSKNDPTSIPSPFARIDLVRSAFKYVVDKNDFENNTIYHKLVSDCFDVAEMFFNIDKLGSKAQVKTWDKNIDLKKLLESENPKHQLYGETLDLFLNQDAQSNNFDSLQKFYFIFYDNKIVGGTSPTTLFFTSANNLSFANIENGNDIFFDDDLKPLYKRDSEFQKYIYLYYRAYPNLSVKMRDFSDYLEQNLKILDNLRNDLYTEIKEFENKSSEELIQELNCNYEALDTGTSGDNIEILGNPLKKKKIGNGGSRIKEHSQFIIDSEKYAIHPLVLQNKFSEPLIYTDSNVKWNSNWQVPYFDNNPINERTLPGQLDKYPYVTVSDFLQPFLIRLIYPINKEKYFDGNIRYETGGDTTKSFILPITNQFFNYFNTSDLQRSMPDGKPMFEMVVFTGSVDVYLRIPIKGNRNVNYITFKRTYDNKGIGGNAFPDIINNKGYVMENQFALAIYPFLKTDNENDSFYRVMFLDRDINANTKHLKYDLDFYKNKSNRKAEYKDKKWRSSKEKMNMQTDFYVLENEFDYIEVRHNDASGIVIPKFEKAGGSSNSFTFAIDFGTTNTHIEYKINDGNPTPLEITKDDVQFATLFSPDIKNDSAFTDARIMSEFIRHELIPEIISKSSEFSFPVRTALNENLKLDLSKSTYSLADFNIPFDYEKYASKVNAKITTNLKWSNNDYDIVRIERFFEKLLFLIRTKILLNNGDLHNTKLFWFYPASMSSNRRDKLEKMWDKLFNKYITNQNSPIKVSESIAPYYFYKKRRGINASDKPVVSIDIGGGTSDIVIYKGKDPILLTSIKFAANSIFGDAYGGSPDINGFILKYKNVFADLLKNNELYNLEAVLEQINIKQKSEDICTYLFSLESNKLIREQNIPISFNEKLGNDDDLKIVFVTFYASIIYHLAKLMHSKKLEAPRNIIFSGTGSKILSIADGSTDFNKLQKLTKIIFAKIYPENKVGKIDLEQDANPKEITCKGGLLIDTEITDIDEIKTVLIGDREDTVIPNSSIKYSEINDSNRLNSIVIEVQSFIDLLFSIHNEYNFTKNFGVNASYIDKYKEVLKEDLMQHLKSGIENKTDELSGNTNIDIEESLFFYPLVGVLNKLAYMIANQLKS